MPHPLPETSTPKITPRTICVALLFLPAFLIEFTALDAGRYDYYFNHRFGFSVEIPSGLTTEPPPTNGDGQVYRAVDGSFRLAVSAIDGATSDTLATFMAADMDACLSHPP